MKIGGGSSLLQRTALRARKVGAAECLVVTNGEYVFRTVEEFAGLGDAGPDRLQLLLEPVGRNTAPAIAAACVVLEAEGKSDESLIVLPADHLIQDEDRFAEVATHAARLASEGHIVLFGIRPTLPETGFGYIECDVAPAGDRAQPVRRFV
jgi:mannose-1-phosphate guanylyltransferase